MRKCSKCGVEVEENSAFCNNCGSKLDTVSNDISANVNTNTTNNNTQISNTKGKSSGVSIAALVIGIIGSIFSLSIITQLSSSVDSLNTLLLDYSTSGEQMAVIIGFIFGYTIFDFIPCIVGTILSIIGISKKKDTLAIVALVLNIICICVSIFAGIYIALHV